MSFDAKAHLIQLPKRVKGQDSQWETIAQDYLEVKYRVLMFREKYPHGCITSEVVQLDWTQGYCVFKSTVEDGEGGSATGYGTETREGFEDFVERGETRSVGRALALLGFGTANAELDERPHVADAPVQGMTARPEAEPVQGQEPVASREPCPGADPVPAETPALPTVIPANLPCAGQTITALNPASLAMLIGKLGHRVASDASYIPLLAALQNERRLRMEQGAQRKYRPLAIAAD